MVYVFMFDGEEIGRGRIVARKGNMIEIEDGDCFNMLYVEYHMELVN